MCIAVFAWQVCNRIPLFLLSNRDEFYARPSLPLSCHDDGICCGTDLTQGGTWLGTKGERWAIITNFRDGRDKREFATSRGQIVKDYLSSDLLPIRYAKALEKTWQDYAGFNLIIGNRTQAVYLSNRGHAPEILHAGVYVLGNGLLTDDWAKHQHIGRRFTQELLPLIGHHGLVIDDAAQSISLDILEDTRTQDRLPDTGVDKAWEKRLSAVFIKSKTYGTRASNILMMTDTHIEWLEKTQAGGEMGKLSKIQYFI